MNRHLRSILGILPYACLILFCISTPYIAAAQSRGFLGLAYNSSADIFRMDYHRTDYYGAHLYGSDYNKGFGGSVVYRLHARPERRAGVGFRLDINYTHISSFTLNQISSDPQLVIDDLKMGIKSLSLGVGAMLWGRYRAVILQPYVAVKPLAMMILNEGEKSGHSMYLGFDAGIEAQVRISRKVHLLFGAGYSVIPKKTHEFNMEIQKSGGGAIYVTKTKQSYKGYLKNTSFTSLVIGFLLDLKR